MALIVQTLTTISYVSNFGCGALVERFHALEPAWETDAREYAFRIQYYCLLALANQSVVSECADYLLECVRSALNSGHIVYFLTPISLAYYNQRVHLAELAGNSAESTRTILLQLPFIVLNEDDGLDDEERFARDFYEQPRTRTDKELLSPAEYVCMALGDVAGECADVLFLEAAEVSQLELSQLLYALATVSDPHNASGAARFLAAALERSPDTVFAALVRDAPNLFAFQQIVESFDDQRAWCIFRAEFLSFFLFCDWECALSAVWAPDLSAAIEAIDARYREILEADVVLDADFGEHELS